MAIDTVIHTNQHSIDRVLGAGVPVLLVFWQAQARPSVNLDPVLAQLAASYAGKALIAKVDAAAERTLVARFGVSRLPTLVFIKQGKTEGIAVGAADAAALSGWLDYLVQGGARPALPSGPAVSLRGEQTTGQAPYTNGAARPNSGPGSSMKQNLPRTLTDVNFQQTIDQPGPVLVDFWAPWCGPCRMVAPAVESLAQEFQGRAVVGKLNVDENPQTAQRYGIMSIPALYIFKNGAVVERIIGAQPAQVLRQKLMLHL